MFGLRFFRGSNMAVSCHCRFPGTKDNEVVVHRPDFATVFGSNCSSAVDARLRNMLYSRETGAYQMCEGIIAHSRWAASMSVRNLELLFQARTWIRRVASKRSSVALISPVAEHPV